MTVPEDIKRIIYPKYSRPTRLSDPGSDFSQEELKAIIHKTDADLTDTDLICIFQSFLPAGEYWESIYFLPLALKRICDTDNDATLCENLLKWIGQQKENLEKDQLYDRLSAFFENLFAELTSAFRLKDGYPENCNRAGTIFDTLNFCSPGSGDLLLRKYVGNAENYERAAWLVFFLHENLYGLHRNSAFLKNIASDKTLLKKAYDLIVAKAMNDDTLLSFWDKRLTSCGIW